MSLQQPTKASLARVFYLSDYGGRADGVTLYDAVFTNGSPNLSSVSASFTSADVNKSIVLQLSSTSRQVLTITTVTDATHVVLSGNATASSSAYTYGITTYGTENTAAIQAVINALGTGGGKILLDGGVYLCTGSLSNTSTLNSVFALPNITYDPLGSGSPSITFEGVCPPDTAFFNPGQRPPLSGTVIYCTNQGVTGSPSALGSYPSIFACAKYAAQVAYPTSNYTTYWGSYNTCLVVRNITLRQPAAPVMNCIQWANGGTLVIDHVSCDLDVPYSSTSNYTPQPPTNCAAIITPQYLSAYWTTIDNLYAYGYGFGVAACDSTSMHHCVFEMCGLGTAAIGGVNALQISDTMFNRCNPAISDGFGTCTLYATGIGIQSNRTTQGVGGNFCPNWTKVVNGNDVVNNTDGMRGFMSVMTVLGGFGAIPTTSSVRNPAVNGGLTIYDIYTNKISGGWSANQITVSGITLPSFAVTTHGTAGSTTYTYIPVYVLNDGSTAQGAPVTITTGNATLTGSNYNILTVSGTVYGISGILFYRTMGGATQGKINSLPDLTFIRNDTGLTGDSTSVPNDTAGLITAKTAVIGSGTGVAKLTAGVVGLATAGTDYSVLTIQTGTLVGGTATKTVPAGCHPWVQDNASSLTNVGSLVVTVSGTTATITSTNILDVSPFTLFNAGSQ